MRRIARSPWVFWAGVALLALVTGATAARLVSGAQVQAARYGSLHPVVVAGRDLDPGTVLKPGDLKVVDMPAAFAPDRRVASVEEARGRTVVAAAFRGLPVLRDHLAPDGLRGIAALLPQGTRAVAVPTGSVSVPLQRGDVVDVLATFDLSESGGGDPTFAVATGAVVVDVGAESATVAVGPEEAKTIAFAVGHGSVTLAVTQPGTELPQEPELRRPGQPGTPRTEDTTPSELP